MDCIMQKAGEIHTLTVLSRKDSLENELYNELVEIIDKYG